VISSFSNTATLKEIASPSRSSSDARKIFAAPFAASRIPAMALLFSLMNANRGSKSLSRPTASSSSSSAGNANSVSNNYSVSKIILPVSNVQLIV
jgi:hypothetical protein